MVERANTVAQIYSGGSRSIFLDAVVRMRYFYRSRRVISISNSNENVPKAKRNAEH